MAFPCPSPCLPVFQTPPCHAPHRSQGYLLVSNQSSLYLIIWSSPIVHGINPNSSIFKALQFMISLYSFNFLRICSWTLHYSHNGRLSIPNHKLHILHSSYSCICIANIGKMLHPLYANSRTPPPHVHTLFPWKCYTPCKGQWNGISSVKVCLIPSKRSFPG